jgi:hypothetical protein
MEGLSIAPLQLFLIMFGASLLVKNIFIQTTHLFQMKYQEASKLQVLTHAT